MAASVPALPWPLAPFEYVCERVCASVCVSCTPACSEDFWAKPTRSQQLADDVKVYVWLACLIYIPLALLLGFIHTYRKRREERATGTSQNALAAANEISMPKKDVQGQKKPVGAVIKAITFLWNIMLSCLAATGLALLLSSSPSKLLMFCYPSSSYSSVTRLVISLFCLSKSFEFFDTLLLFFRGKKPSFMHMYHHVTVTLYSWHALSVDVPFAHGFVCLNMFVHTIVHAYFAAEEYETTKRLMRFLRSYVTLLQLSQMVIGICISSQAIFHPTVDAQPLAALNAKLGLTMYVSYAALFLNFYLATFHKQLRSVQSSVLLLAHIAALIGLIKIVSHERCWSLVVDVAILYTVGCLGITCGAHRLWAHRSYKATAPFRCFLMLLTSLANQGSIYHWARDHRVHHKHSDQPADPYNASRGFFYSHVGWLLLRKPKEVSDAGKCIDNDDLLADPFVRFQHRFDPLWNAYVCFLTPSVYAYFVYNDFWTGFFVLGFLRWCMGLHATWTVNSVAHIWGDRPYETTGYPCESPATVILAVGEGWHNWHHLYPFDYAAAEGGAFTQFNPSKCLIDIAAFLGLASGRRRAVGAWQRKQADEIAAVAVRRACASEMIRSNQLLNTNNNLRLVLNQKESKISGMRSMIRLCFDVLVVCVVWMLTLWVINLFLSKPSSPSSVVDLSPYLVLPVLTMFVGMLLGTMYFSLYMHSYAAASGTFSGSEILNHSVGMLCSIFLLLPYQPKRFMCRGETPAIKPYLFNSCFAAFTIVSWSSWISCSFAGVGLWCTLLWFASHGWLLEVCALYALPHIVMDMWIFYYFTHLEKKGPHDVKNNNCRYDFSVVFPSALSWLNAQLEKRKREKPSPLSQFIDWLHQRIRSQHLVQAFSFEVPLNRSAQALEFLRQRLSALSPELLHSHESFPGFGLDDPKARVEAYDAANAQLTPMGTAHTHIKKTEKFVDGKDVEMTGNDAIRERKTAKCNRAVGS